MLIEWGHLFTADNVQGCSRRRSRCWTPPAPCCRPPPFFTPSVLYTLSCTFLHGWTWALWGRGGRSVDYQFSLLVSELTVLIQNEVCRLQIIGGQLLFSCGFEHFSKPVHKATAVEASAAGVSLSFIQVLMNDFDEADKSKCLKNSTDI